MRSVVEAVDRILDRRRVGELDTAHFRWLDEDRRIPDVMPGLLEPDIYDPAFGTWLDTAAIPLAGGCSTHPCGATG